MDIMGFLLIIILWNCIGMDWSRKLQSEDRVTDMVRVKVRVRRGSVVMMRRNEQSSHAAP